VDPLGPDPVLITGSANFSNNSTLTNDENSLIIRGDSAIMDIYVTEFMRMFEHYWFRAHMQGKTGKGKNKKKSAQDLAVGLREDASWSVPYYQAGSHERLDRLA